MSSFNLEESLLTLPCHFTWKELKEGHIGRTVEMNIDSLSEHIQQTIQGTEVESYNLMGFYKTKQKSYQEAREHFHKALEYTKTKEEQIVCSACLTWLTWTESDSDCSAVQDKVEEIKKLINEIESENISEVMAEKAFSILHSGFTQSGFTEAYRCIAKALTSRPDSMKLKFIKGNIMKHLYKEKVIPCSPIEGPVLEMQKDWKEIVETPKEDAKYSSIIRVQSLIEYAEFLHQVNWDYGESGRKIAEEAERVADKSNTVIMCKLAEFYIHSAKHNTKILEKAENILDKILEGNPDCSRTLHLKGLLFFDKYRFSAKEEKEKYFNEAKCCLYKSWHSADKRDVSPALDIVRMYEQKYEDTADSQLVIDVEELFREIFKEVNKLHDFSKALVHENYGAFLKTHSKVLVLSHLKMSFQYHPVPEDEQPRHPLWDFARDLSLLPDLKDQKEGSEILGWMNEMLTQGNDA